MRHDRRVGDHKSRRQRPELKHIAVLPVHCPSGL